MRRLATTALLITLTVTPAFGGDNSLSSVVKFLQSNYKAQKQSLHGGGFLARVAVKIIRPAGVKGLRFTILKELRVPDSAGLQFSEFLDRSVNPKWRPMVRQFSRRGGEWTWVYAQPDGKDIKLLIISRQRRDAVVAEARIDPARLNAFIDDPRILGISVGDRRSPGPVASTPVP